MKTIFTLLSALVLATTSFAQYSHNFDGSITSGCTVLSSVNQTTTAGEVITGTGSLYSNPPVNGSSTRDFSTPYLDINSTSLTVSFNYKLNNNLTGQAERTIQVGLEDLSGFALLATILMDNNNDPVVSTPFSQTFTVATGTKRLSIKMGGSQGNGAVRVIIDDLNVSVSSHYVGGCNSAPIAVANNFFSATSLPYSDNVTGNDSDPNAGETIAASMVTQPPATEGIVSLNANGDFTFTPAVGFLGGTVTFTYRVTDNGYDPMSSTATVTIDYPSFIPLPVQLISFNGSLINNKVQLKWLVAENETGEHFEIEKSNDGTTFKSIGIVFLTSNKGTQDYSFNEGIELTGAGYYRLKIVNKSGAIVYSNIVVLKNDKAGITNSLVVLQNKGASISFNYTTSKAGIYHVNVYNVSGAKMFATSINMQKGMNAASLKANGLIGSGVYVLEVTNGSDRSIIKFLK